MKNTSNAHDLNTLQLRRLGIDTYDEPVIYMRSDCHVCRSEGFESRSRIAVRLNAEHTIATLHMITSDLLHVHEASLSDAAWKLLGAKDGDLVTVSHPDPVESLSHVRTKVYGGQLDDAAIHAIVRDVANRQYSDIHLSAFITACAGDRLNARETIALTRAMVAVGEQLSWGRSPIVDKHSVGGLPGNRTTPIVVSVLGSLHSPPPRAAARRGFSMFSMSSGPARNMTFLSLS